MFTDRKSFSIKENIKFLRFSCVYNIFDGEGEEQIGFAKEENSFKLNFFRFLISKLFLPNKLCVYDSQTKDLAFSIRKKYSFFNNDVNIRDSQGDRIGKIKKKTRFLDKHFCVFNSSGDLVGEAKGDWMGWNFKFCDGAGDELGTISKKWPTIGQKNQTYGDNYMILLSDKVSCETDIPKLLLATTLAIDVMYREK